MKYESDIFDRNLIAVWTLIIWIIVMFFCVRHERFERDQQWCDELLARLKVSSSSIAGWDTLAARSRLFVITFEQDDSIEYVPIGNLDEYFELRGFVDIKPDTTWR